MPEVVHMDAGQASSRQGTSPDRRDVRSSRRPAVGTHENPAPTGVAGIYTDPKHVIHYTSDDEVRQEFTVVYRADYLSGEPTASSETTHVQWVPVADLDTLTMDRSQRLRIQWAISQQGTWIDPAGD